MNEIIPPRLRWACRRGMLELDLILNNYLEEAYLSLPEDEQQLFVQLLEVNDQDLFLWLTGKETTKDQKLSNMVEKIRYHAQHRH